MIRIVAEPYDGPGAAVLVPAVQQEYVRRYGGEDDTPLTPAEFLPPAGRFLVAYDGPEPVACAGWRRTGPGVAEMKRLYVVPGGRGQGLARRLLAEIEADVAASGCAELKLETGSAQPEAVRLYETSGYTRIANYGHYAESESNVCFGKRLPVVAGGGVSAVTPAGGFDRVSRP